MVMGRNTAIVLLDEDGTERTVHRIPYGTHLRVDDGVKVKRGDRLAEWDPYTRPVLTEIEGIVDFEDLVEGVSVSERRDEFDRYHQQRDHRLARLAARRRSSAGDGDQGQEGQDRQAVARRRGPLSVARRCDPVGRARPSGDGRRRARPYPDRERQDARHHRRLAAGGGAVRGAQAQGPRHHRRGLGHGAAWPRLQEQAAHHHRRRTRAASRSSI